MWWDLLYYILCFFLKLNTFSFYNQIIIYILKRGENRESQIVLPVGSNLPFCDKFTSKSCNVLAGQMSSHSFPMCSTAGCSSHGNNNTIALAIQTTCLPPICFVNRQQSFMFRSVGKKNFQFSNKRLQCGQQFPQCFKLHFSFFNPVYKD